MTGGGCRGTIFSLQIRFLRLSLINHLRSVTMPVIARFYGIIIKMYFSRSEHGVPHFHAIYGEFNAVFRISDLSMMEGDLPVRAQSLVKEWASLRQKDLLAIWEQQEFKQLPGLD
jgi:hypothetical protein